MNRALTEKVTKEEVHDTLFSMQKGRVIGLDGLIVEFYVGFYDLIKEYILKVVRESQNSSKMLGSFNSTFPTLIPKSQSGRSFSDYRPISCCNVIYNTMSKVITRCLKPMLSEVISKEQFHLSKQSSDP
jgi:hypothetical protein